MMSDYVDNWESLPLSLQALLEPIIAYFDEAADLLFDRRLNLSFEAAVKELSIPGIVALTEGIRELRSFLTAQVQVQNASEGILLWNGAIMLTAYDLPIYTPCVYLSQLAQFMDSQNIRVWKESTAKEIVETLLVMSRYVRPDIETARVTIAALHDMAYLYPPLLELVEVAAHDGTHPNTAQIAASAAALAKK